MKIWLVCGHFEAILRVSLGQFGSFLAAISTSFGVILGLFWTIYDHFWGHFRVIFGDFWGHLGHFGVILDSLCRLWGGHSMVPWVIFEHLLGHFATIFGSVWGHFMVILVSFWEAFLNILGYPGTFFDHLRTGSFGIILALLGPLLDHLGTILGPWWGNFGATLGIFGPESKERKKIDFSVRIQKINRFFGPESEKKSISLPFSFLAASTSPSLICGRFGTFGGYFRENVSRLNWTFVEFNVFPSLCCPAVALNRFGAIAGLFLVTFGPFSRPVMVVL